MKNKNARVFSEEFSSFRILCIALAVGAIPCKLIAGLDASTESPSERASEYLASIKVNPSTKLKDATELKIGDANIGFGGDGKFSFSADSRGVARVPISLSVDKAEKEYQHVWLTHDLGFSNVLWGRNVVELKGLRPNGKYQAEAALWFKGPTRMAQNGQNTNIYKTSGPVKKCGNQCVVALGTPSLVGVPGNSISGAVENVGLAVAGTWPRIFASWTALGLAFVLAASSEGIRSVAKVAAGRPPKRLATRRPRVG